MLKPVYPEDCTTPEQRAEFDNRVNEVLRNPHRRQIKVLVEIRDADSGKLVAVSKDDQPADWNHVVMAFAKKMPEGLALGNWSNATFSVAYMLLEHMKDAFLDGEISEIRFQQLMVKTRQMQEEQLARAAAGPEKKVLLAGARHLKKI